MQTEYEVIITIIISNIQYVDILNDNSRYIVPCLGQVGSGCGSHSYYTGSSSGHFARIVVKFISVCCLLY